MRDPAYVVIHLLQRRVILYPAYAVDCSQCGDELFAGLDGEQVSIRVFAQERGADASHGRRDGFRVSVRVEGQKQAATGYGRAEFVCRVEGAEPAHGRVFGDGRRIGSGQIDGVGVAGDVAVEDDARFPEFGHRLRLNRPHKLQQGVRACRRLLQLGRNGRLAVAQGIKRRIQQANNVFARLGPRRPGPSCCQKQPSQKGEQHCSE